MRLTVASRETIVATVKACTRASSYACIRGVFGSVASPRLAKTSDGLGFRFVSRGLLRVDCRLPNHSLPDGRV